MKTIDFERIFSVYMNNVWFIIHICVEYTINIWETKIVHGFWFSVRGGVCVEACITAWPIDTKQPLYLYEHLLILLLMRTLYYYTLYDGGNKKRTRIIIYYCPSTRRILCLMLFKTTRLRFGNAHVCKEALGRVVT